ncbi:hypothetical protein CN918_26585 [Priestia megaterium]|nr:hypothetical protein CN918_26585 [Priestia megaterium]
MIMFRLHVRSTSLDFVTFLRQESTYLSEEDVYLFTSMKQAARVITRYLVFFLKEVELMRFVSLSCIEESEKSTVASYVSTEKIKKIYKFVHQKLLVFLFQSSSFDFEGFIRFRLSIEQQMIAAMMELALGEFQEAKSDPSTIEILQSLLSEQPTLESHLVVSRNQNGSFTIVGADKVYLQDEHDEDTLLSHIILLGPQTIDIYESGTSISPAYTIILTKLFGNRVVFHGYSNCSPAHPKKKE